MSYERGSAVRLRLAVKSGDDLVDPDDVTLDVRAPSGAVTSYAWQGAGTVQRDALGEFSRVVELAEAGVWAFTWATSGAFQVVRSGRLHVLEPVVEPASGEPPAADPDSPAPTVYTLEVDVSALLARVAALEPTVHSLEVDVSAMLARVASLEVDVSALLARVAALETPATSALLELRDTIIEYVWGRAGLPTQHPTTVTDPSSSTGTPQASWPADCVRMTEFSCTLPRAGSYRSRLAHPALLPAYQGGAGRRNELVIIMGGHGANWMSGNAGYLTLGLLRYGYHVLACDMPMFDLNASNSAFTSLLGSAITITNNHDMSALEADGINGLRIFLDGHIHVINYCLDRLGFRRVRLVGLSGGGWSGEWLGAVDPRITAVHSVMGSLPFSMRAARGGPGDNGDWEQFPARGFWAAAGGLEENVYKLACLEEGRRLVKYCGDLEPVFPTASLHSQLATMESDIAESVNGSFALSFNASTTVHDYTVGTGTLEQIIQSTTGFVGQILSNLNAS